MAPSASTCGAGRERPIRGLGVKIVRLAVQNYARFRDLGIEVRDHLVVVGANDVGKTSLLRLLSLMLSGHAGQLLQAFSAADLRDGSAPLVVIIRFADFTDAERAVFYREIAIDADDFGETLTIRMEVAADPDDADAVSIRRWFPERGDERGPSREQLQAFSFRYLPASRGSASSQLEGPNSALQALLRSAPLGSEAEELAGLLDEFNGKLAESPVLSDLRTQVAKRLSRAMPETIQADGLAVRNGRDPAGSILDNVSMFFVRDGDYESIGQQSDGVRQLIAMTLFDLAEGSANVVAIDEPELHLHPTSQRTVAELFVGTTGAGNQKILATHSPYILQRFEPSQVLAMAPDGHSHQVAATKLTAIEKLRAHWWSPKLLEALASRFVIVVEGIADRIVVDAVARALQVPLDRLGAVVFEIDGAGKFPDVYKLLGPDGFGVSVLGLVDADHKNKWHGAIGGKEKDVIGSRLWVSDADLEDEYCAAFSGPEAGRILIEAGCCREAGILSSCGVDALHDLDAAAVADFCRKEKVASAVAVAGALTPEVASNVQSVAGLLRRLQVLAGHAQDAA